MPDYDAILFASVKMVTDRLTDDELVALNMAALMGANPVEVMGYEKAESLFTAFEHTRMHARTLEIFTSICDQRLEQPPGAKGAGE